MKTVPNGLQTAPGCFLLALIASAPLCFSPFDRLIGHEDVDATNHAWGAWWWWHSLSEGSLPRRTGLLATPEGGVLWFIDPWGALFGTPLVPLLGAIGAYNMVILLDLCLAAAGGRALARAFGASDRAAWIGAAAAVFSPYFLSEDHNGVSEAVGVGWSSFALAAAWRALRSKTAGDLRLWAKVGL